MTPTITSSCRSCYSTNIAFSSRSTTSPSSQSMLRAKRTHKWFPRSTTSSRGTAAPPSTCRRRGAKCTSRRRSANGSSTASTRRSCSTSPPDWCAYRTSNPYGGRSGPKATAPRSCAGRCGRTSLGTSTASHGGTYSSAASSTSSASGSESTPYTARQRQVDTTPPPYSLVPIWYFHQKPISLQLGAVLPIPPRDNSGKSRCRALNTL